MSYPVNLRVEAPLDVDNWRPLVQWILAIPHLIIASALDSLASVLALVSWFIILFTGELPKAIADLQCMILRYEARAYSYALWLREEYPKFEFDLTADDPGTDPVRVDFEPDLTDRNRLTVGLRFLWIIPIGIFAGLVAIAAWFALVVSFFAVLFTGRWPESIHRFAVGAARLLLQVNAYGRLLVDEYPPFSFEDGGEAATVAPA
jgi:hypothetical protein